MVRKVIVIGFIGFLIALSNAMEEQQAVDVKYVADAGNGLPNFVDGLEKSDAFTYGRNQYMFKPEICPEEYMSCQTNNRYIGCLKTNKEHTRLLKPEHVDDLSIFTGKEVTFTCQKPESTMKPSLFQFFHDFRGFKEVKLGAPKPSIYCTAILDDEQNTTKYFVFPSDKIPSEDDKALLKKIKFHGVAINNQKYKSITCEGVSGRNYRWIIILALLALVAAACYWFLCCDEDDDDKEDYNKNGGP